MIFHQFLCRDVWLKNFHETLTNLVLRKVKASQCDQLLKDIGALKQQLQIPKRLKPQTSAVDVSEKC